MPKTRTIALDAVRTDGWFERIGDGIASFQALCEIVGEVFFAFSMITGARIVSLTVDRRNPDNTVVDFVVGGSSEGESDSDVQRLTLGDFRERLVGAILAEDLPAPFPLDEYDTEGIQQHIGIRFLLLAPIYGYSLRELLIEGNTSSVLVLRDGVEELCELDEFRHRIRSHVREELDRVSSGGRGAIDLAKVAEVEIAEQAGEYNRIVQLIGTWPSPLAIFLRTPEGQMLTIEARTLIAKGLGALGTSFVKLGEEQQGEEILRLGIQYGQDTAAAGEIFRRLGETMMTTGRYGEALGLLRRAANLGASGKKIWPVLAEAFTKRDKFVAAWACIREARSAGVADSEMTNVIQEIEQKLGSALTVWQAKIATIQK